jgi:predicted deacetylase
MRNHSKSARYLLRFDDICPTMNWSVWSEIEAALMARHLKPILAVVPDNRDPVLRVSAPVADFWERVRQWQARGWTIALHGFQHKYVARRDGIGTVRKSTEFAGVPAEEQAEKLRRGTRIFEREGIRSSVWIAPNNSFDATTVRLLPGFGINIICDGNFRFPFVSPEKMVWVPQQLFGFRPAPPGVWTVCYHHNEWTAASIGQFCGDLDRYGAEISSLDEVVREQVGGPSRWSSFLCASPRIAPFLIRCQLKLWNSRRLPMVSTPASAKKVSNCPAA